MITEIVGSVLGAILFFIVVFFLILFCLFLLAFALVQRQKEIDYLTSLSKDDREIVSQYKIGSTLIIREFFRSIFKKKEVN